MGYESGKLAGTSGFAKEIKVDNAVLSAVKAVLWEGFWKKFTYER